MLIFVVEQLRIIIKILYLNDNSGTWSFKPECRYGMQEIHRVKYNAIQYEDFHARSKATQCKLYWHAQHSNSRQKTFQIKIKWGCSIIHGQQKTGRRVVPHSEDFFAKFEKCIPRVNNSLKSNNFPQYVQNSAQKRVMKLIYKKSQVIRLHISATT